MSFISIIVAGLTVSIIAKLLMPHDGVGGLFILGFGGSIIAGVIEYSFNQPIGFVAPLTGAVILLAIYAVTPRREIARRTADEVRHDDVRRAA
jgi:uncharacterized membrane protein YeaQ/YmgE (transglycosylase-associated protein family)